MKDRLKELRKSLGLTQGEFGKKIGMSDVAISHMESGRTAISKQNTLLICSIFKANEEWLETGKGEMMNEAATLSKKGERLLSIFGQLSPRAQNMLIEYAEKLASDEATLRGDTQPGEVGEKTG
jgi:transcriptional regulator with XRE-family HTH domain